MRRLIAALLLLSAAALTTPAAAQANQCEEPNVLVALDRSGSMLEDGKWNQAVDAITQLTRTFEFRIRFGLLAFPWGGRCDVSAPGAVLAGVAPLNGPAIRDQLARAFPQQSNKTPIGGAIDASVNYYFQLQDPNRRSFIVLITDGMETCNGNPVRSAQNAFQGAGLPVYVIGFGRGVDQRILNQMAEVGGTQRAYQANNGPDLFAALEAIADAASEETCDGKDNDCDGEVDEGLGDQPCSTACGDGRQICVDGGYSECFGGGIPDEVCDGVDNDCDTRVDEIAGVPCSTVSGNPGLAACVGGAVSDDCIPEDPSREEVCDAFDNDMDGQVDENTDQACNNGCHQGRRPCVDGAYLGCTALQVGDELCDGLDNDCDGLVDESAQCAGEETCGDEGLCLNPCPFNECPSGFLCEGDGFCHPVPCDPGCAAGERCIDRQCLRTCAIDRDCGDGWICVTRLCEPRPDGPGAGGAGGTPGAGGSGGGSDRPDMSLVPPGGGFTPDAGAGQDPLKADGGCHCDLRSGPDAPADPWALLALVGLLGLARRRAGRPRR